MTFHFLAKVAHRLDEAKNAVDATVGVSVVALLTGWLHELSLWLQVFVAATTLLLAIMRIVIEWPRFYSRIRCVREWIKGKLSWASSKD